jgi:hypothetical protein
MKRVLPIALCIGAMVLASAAMAGVNDNLDVRFALHARDGFTAKTAPAPCLGGADPVALGIPCSDYDVDRAIGEFPGPWVYLVTGQGGTPGINGVSFGIDYTPGSGPGNGISEALFTSQANWSLCNDGLDFPSGAPQPVWPAPGSGMLLTWATCQTTSIPPDGAHALIAKFYVYAYGNDTLEITPNLTKVSGPELDINTCGAGTTKLLAITAPSLHPFLVGKVQFGAGRDGILGYTPCGVVATETSTWGRIKTLFDEKSGE